MTAHIWAGYRIIADFFGLATGWVEAETRIQA